MKKLESLIKTYNDFPKKGIAFKDILGIIRDPEVFRELIFKMSSNHVIKNSEAIISIEARGFIFGSAISLQACKPMIVARKPEKLPGELIKENYNLEYGKSSLSLQKKSIEQFVVTAGGSLPICARSKIYIPISTRLKIVGPETVPPGRKFSFVIF